MELSRTVAICKALEEVKKASSKWIKTMSPEFSRFAWQGGYGVFAVSESNAPAVHKYFAEQKDHHRRKTFQEEYTAFLQKHRVPCDERYVWD